jgi:RNA polymerase sigma factor (sigma-70 family)
MHRIAAIYDNSKGKAQKRTNKKYLSLASDFMVGRFFSYPKNVNLLHSYLDSQSSESWEKLEEAFVNFCFEVRLTKYLSSTIKFTYFDYERKRRKRMEKNIAILDMGVHEDQDETLGERYVSRNDDELFNLSRPDPQKMLDSLSNESVYEAFSKLTQNQKTILTFTYAMGYPDKAIAEKMSVTPQAVSKARNAALANLRRQFERASLQPRTRREAN